MENASTLSGIPPHSQTGPEPPPNLAAALDLKARDYDPIPFIVGTKRPAVKRDEWLKNLSTETIHNKWSQRDFGVGLILRDNHVVLDSDTPEAEATIQELCKKYRAYSNMILKTTRGYHHHFKLDPGTTIKPCTFATQRYPGRIDVLTWPKLALVCSNDGRYFITPGSPNLNDLVVLTPDFIEAIGWHNSPETELKPIPKALAAPNDPRQLPGKECRILIDHLDPDMHHDDWIKVGMALHHNFGGSDEGLEIFDYWSSKGRSYPGRKELEQKWRSFKHLRDLGRPGYTMGTVCLMVEDLGHDWQMVCADAQGAFEVCAPASPVKPVEAKVVGILERFSVRGKLAELKAKALARVFVLPGIALSTQITVIYASPNAGKTLVILSLFRQQINEGRIDPDCIFFVNADDGFRDALDKAEALGLTAPHTLIAGEEGFDPDNFSEVLEALIATGEAAGKILILDTAKKFFTLTCKENASAYMTLLRRFTMAQGTVILLAHANKRHNLDSPTIPGGTSDVADDADAVYTMQVDPKSLETPETIVIVEARKTRGSDPGPHFFAFSNLGLWGEKYVTVRKVDRVELDGFEPVKPDDDDRLIEIVKDAIRGGFTKKMSLRDEVSRVGGVSKARALKVIELHTGPVPSLHHWNFEVGARGANNYILLDCGSNNHTQLDDDSSVDQEAF